MNTLNNLSDYNSFINNKYNEGVIDFLKKSFNKLKDFSKRIKESVEIDTIINKSEKQLKDLLNEKLPEYIKNKAEEYLKLKKKNKKSEIDNMIDELFNNLYNYNKQTGLLKKYIESDNKKIKLYTQSKLANLRNKILSEKINIFKQSNNDNIKKSVMDLANKLKENEQKEQDFINELSKISDKKEKIFEIGDIYNYYSEKAKKNEIIKIKEISEDKKKIIKADVIDDKGKVLIEDIKPITDNIKDKVENK